MARSHFILFFLAGALLQAQQPLVDLEELSEDFSYDIRYATTQNFTGKQLYPCSKCLLRPEVANALVKANNYFGQKGYRILLFDCYRPLSVQQKMWSIIPNASYVADPNNGGSIHNRGAAVDIGLERLDGSPLNMGSDYDHFGRESHIDFEGLPKETRENRELLFEGMRRFGFSPIRTEWWHFSYRANSGDPLNEPLPCSRK